MTTLSQAISAADAPSENQATAKFYFGRFFIYGALTLWTIICLFPIYWTLTTSFKVAKDVQKGAITPGWISSPTGKAGSRSAVAGNHCPPLHRARRVLKRFFNSAITSVSASLLAVLIGSLAAYGLTRFAYKIGWMRNKDISFFFLSQLILPPVVLALPFLALYKELALLDTTIGLVMLYTLMVLRSSSGSCATSSLASRWSSRKRRWWMACRSGAPSSASSFRSPRPAWWRPSFWRWFCAGTNISSPPSSPPPTPRRCGDGGEPDGSQGSTGGRWRRCRRRRLRRSS